jgi:zinc transport system substrate-binding protein
MRRHPLLASVLAGLLATATLGGCAGRDRAAADPAHPLTAVVGFYPLQFLAERIGGPRVRVTNLVHPGAEPHDLELQPRQVATLADASLVIYLAGFQPALDDARADAAPRSALDVSTVEPLQPAPAGAEAQDGGKKLAKDPHVWLDPVRFAAIAHAVAERFAAIDAANADGYRTRAAALTADLALLDRDYAEGLKTCARHEIVTSHAAFGYLAARYHLVQLPISGLSPEEEPTPQHLAAVADLARREAVTTIFFESLVSPKVARTLAREIDARVQVLDPIEGSAGGADYLSLMRTNLGRLRQALGCS